MGGGGSSNQSGCSGQISNAAPLVNRALWEVVLSMYLSVFKDSQITGGTHTPSQPAMRAVALASSWKESGMGLQEGWRPWLPATSLPPGPHQHCLRASFSSLSSHLTLSMVRDGPNVTQSIRSRGIQTHSSAHPCLTPSSSRSRVLWELPDAGLQKVSP